MSEPLSDENRKTLERVMGKPGVALRYGAEAVNAIMNAVREEAAPTVQGDVREAVEAVILRRLRENKIDGYTLAMSDEIAAILSTIRPDTRGEATKREPNPEWEAKAAALRASDERTIEPEMTLKMLRTWTADAEPANELGQISFSRAMLESAADVIEHLLAHPAPPIPAEVGEIIRRLENKALASFDANKRFGRRGKEWALETENEWQAAQTLRALAVQVGETQKANRAVMDRLSEVSDDRGRVCAERDTLKAALEKIDSYGVNHTSRFCRDIARAALNTKAGG